MLIIATDAYTRQPVVVPVAQIESIETLAPSDTEDNRIPKTAKAQIIGILPGRVWTITETPEHLYWQFVARFGTLDQRDNLIAAAKEISSGVTVYMAEI